jgi:hypothetical protein
MTILEITQLKVDYSKGAMNSGDGIAVGWLNQIDPF